MTKISRPGLVFIGLIFLALAAGCVPTGSTATPTDQATGISSILPLIIFLVLIFAMFYLLILRPQRRRQREQQNLLGQLKRGDRVLTAGGVFGVVEATDEETVVIKVESGALLRLAKGSIVSKR